MNTWFVVEAEGIAHCITTRERLTQLCFGNTKRRCYAVFHILHKNVPGSCASFLIGGDSGILKEMPTTKRRIERESKKCLKDHVAWRRPKSRRVAAAPKMVVRARLGSGRTGRFR